MFWATDLHSIPEVEGQPSAPGAVDGIFHHYAGRARLERFADMANASAAGLVLFTGDIVAGSGSGDYSTFTQVWGEITRPKELTVGNHDMQAVGYEGAVAALGYGARPLVAGSRFNRSFSVAQNGVSARVIMLDTNWVSEGVHGATYTGRVYADARAWVEAQLAASSEEVVLLVSHHGPHVAASFDASDAAALAGLVQAAKQAKPNRHFWHLFGHEHYTNGAKRYDSLWPAYPGIQGGVMVDDLVGRCQVLRFYPGGRMEMIPVAL